MIPESFMETAGNYRVSSGADSNLPVTVLSVPRAATAAYLLMFRDGVAYEPPDMWGIAHFIEHIVFRGTGRFPSLYELSCEAEGNGGRVSAYSTRDMTAFWVKFPPGNDERALDILAELVGNPLLREEFIRKERDIIHQERIRERNNPSLYNSLMMEEILLHPEPICRHPIGSDEVIDSLHAEKLASHLQKAYHRDNMFLVAAGRVSPDFNRLAEDFVNRFPGGSRMEPLHFSVPGEYGTESVFHLPTHHKTQVFLSAGWRVCLEERDEIYAWRILNSMLGVGYTSLFNRKLREEENLTYLCTTNLNLYGDRGDSGVYKINLSLEDRNLGRALDLIGDIIHEAAGGRIDGEVFRQARIKHASHVLYQAEDTLELAKIAGTYSFRNVGPYDMEEYFRSLNRVKVEDLSRIARRELDPGKRKVFFQTGSEAAVAQFPRVTALSDRM